MHAIELAKGKQKKTKREEAQQIDLTSSIPPAYQHPCHIFKYTVHHIIFITMALFDFEVY